MRRSPAILGIVFLLSLAAPVYGNDSLSTILEGVKNKHAHLPGLTITYTREVITRAMSMLGGKIKGDLATGKIYSKPPNFLRLEQETPKPETIVTNGHTLWWYVPEKELVYQYPSQKFGQELRLLSDVFHGLRMVEKKFIITMVGKTQESDYQIELRPDPQWEQIDRILLTITPAYDIRVVEIYNPLGSISRFKLEEIVINKDFEEGLFEYKVPKGVKLIKEMDQ
jgi:outer membrane lipoprotein-sorting protein